MMKNYIFICDTFSNHEVSAKSSEIIISEIADNLKSDNTDCSVYSKNTLIGGSLTKFILQKLKHKKSFFLRALSDFIFSIFILNKQFIPKNSILIFYTPPPILPFIFLLLKFNINNRVIILVRDIFPLCMKNHFNFINYYILSFMQDYILRKSDKILIESNSQKKFFKNYKNVFEFKNPLNKKRISSIKLNKKQILLKGVYFGNYGLQHENKILEMFLDLCKNNKISCSYYGQVKKNLNFTNVQNSVQFSKSKKVLNNISFQLVSINDSVTTEPLPYKLIELAALSIPPIFFAPANHYFHNEIKKFNIGISVSTISELLLLFDKDNKIYNYDFIKLGENARKYVFKNHVFSFKDRSLFE